jgi:hypothetical protein
LGNFCNRAETAYISQEDIDNSLQREIVQPPTDQPIIIGVDIAGGLEKDNDFTGICIRHHNIIKSLTTVKMSSPQLRAHIRDLIKQFNGEIIVKVDTTNNASFYQELCSDCGDLADIRECPFQGKATAMDPEYGKPANKRVQIYYKLKEWIINTGTLVNNPALLEEIGILEPFKSGIYFDLTRKDKVRSILGRSPDLSDALAITFY